MAGADSSSSSLSSPDPVTAVSIAYPGRSLALTAPPPSSRRPPPPCWSHEETLALIDSYRDKWYSLRRGNLRALHWEEVADAVSHRCPAAPLKTSVQCRHKVEKLRRRLRAEKQRSLAHDPSVTPWSSWVFFAKMDAMERGSATSSRPSPVTAPPDYDNEDDDEEDDDVDDRRGTTRSLHRLMANGGGGLTYGTPKVSRPKVERSRVEEIGARLRPSPNPNRRYSGFVGTEPEMHVMDKKRRREERWEVVEEEDEEAEEEDEEVEKVKVKVGGIFGGLASALRMLGDSFLRTEQMKMEMAREREKVRMEMELKRTEILLDCHRSMVESLANSFLGKK